MGSGLWVMGGHGAGIRGGARARARVGGVGGGAGAILLASNSGCLTVSYADKNLSMWVEMTSIYGNGISKPQIENRSSQNSRSIHDSFTPRKSAYAVRAFSRKNRIKVDADQLLLVDGTMGRELFIPTGHSNFSMRLSISAICSLLSLLSR